MSNKTMQEIIDEYNKEVTLAQDQYHNRISRAKAKKEDAIEALNKGKV